MDELVRAISDLNYTLVWIAVTLVGIMVVLMFKDERR